MKYSYFLLFTFSCFTLQSPAGTRRKGTPRVLVYTQSVISATDAVALGYPANG